MERMTIVSMATTATLLVSAVVQAATIGNLTNRAELAEAKGFELSRVLADVENRVSVIELSSQFHGPANEYPSEGRLRKTGFAR